MNQYFPNLFTPGKIGTRIVKNRIVAAPVGDNMSNNDGSITDQAIAYYTERAKGGASIVMPGTFIIDPEGLILSNNPRIDQDVYIKGVAKMAASVHSYGALLIPQLAHAGARVHTLQPGVLPRCVSDVEPETTSIRKCRAKTPHKELTHEEIKGLIPKFVEGARRCQIAGCDGVELHLAHSYLLGEFLSPDTNHRTDEYGGTLENRMRICLEIVRAIREKCGRSFIIGARVPGAEYVTNRITDEEFPLIAKALEEAGCDILSVSVGMTTNQMKIKEPEGTPEGARLDNAIRIRRAVSIPVMTSGVLKTPAFCEHVIADDIMDFVVLARALNCDPWWPTKARMGRPDLIKPCLSCNGCFDIVDKSHPLGCVLSPTTGNELNNAECRQAEVKKNVMIIGGGIGGMQAAITCAKRGHTVDLYERDDRLGGQMNLACVPPCKDAIREACHWFIAEMDRLGVRVHMNHKISLEDVKRLHPDHIICSMGAKPVVPPFKGKELGVQSWDVLSGNVPMPVGKRVTVIGGGMVGCEAALTIAMHNNRVTIVEMLPALAEDMEISNKTQLFNHLNEHHVQQYASTKVRELTEQEVICDTDGGELRIATDVIVLAVGFRAQETELYEALLREDLNVSIVGNGLTPAKFLDATKGAYQVASVI